MFDEVPTPTRVVTVVDSRAVLAEDPFLNELALRMGASAALRYLVRMHHTVRPYLHRSILVIVDSSYAVGQPLPGTLNSLEHPFEVGVLLTAAEHGYEEALTGVVCQLIEKSYAVTLVSENVGAELGFAFAPFMACSVRDHAARLQRALAIRQINLTHVIQQQVCDRHQVDCLIQETGLPTAEGEAR